MVDPCLLNVTGEHLCFGELRCRLPISVENIGGIIDLIAFKDVQVQRRKAVDHIAPEVLRAKDAEVGSHVPQMFVTLADNSLLSFGFALYDLVDIRFPVILKAGSRTEDLPRDLRLLYRRHRGSAFGSPDFTTSQHLQRNIHSRLDDGKAAVGVQQQRGVKDAVFDDEGKFCGRDQLALITPTTLPTGSIMVISMPIHNVVVMLKGPFLFRQISEDLPFAVGVQGRCSPPWDRNPRRRVGKKAVKLKTRVVLLRQRYGDIEFIAGVQRIEVALRVNDTFAGDIRMISLLFIKNLQTEKARLVPVSCAQSHAVSTRYAGLPDHPKRDTILPCREDGDCISFG